MDIREVFRKFQPEVPVFVLSRDKDGKPNGMVAGWNTKCSHDPARFAVCLSKKGNTQNLVRESGEFVVAMPNEKLEEIVNFFGSAKGRELNKFEESGVKTKKATHINVPLLEDATINLECKVHKEVDAGDHFIFIGDVLAWHVKEDKGILVYMGRDKEENMIFKEF